MKDLKLYKNQDPKNYWMQLKRLEKLNRSSEVKAGVIFSFHSLILGLFADRIDYFKALFSDHTIILILVAFWLLCAVVSIFYCFKCFKPILIKAKYDDNVFFFGDVVSKFGSIDEYVKKVTDITRHKKDLFVQLAQQLHVESTIVTVKFKNVQKSIFYFMFSIAFIILTFTTMFIV